MDADNKMARDLTLLSVALLAGMLWLASNFGFEQRWVVESRDGAAARPDTIGFYTPRRSRPRVYLTTACDRYEGHYSRRLGQLALYGLDPSFRACAPDDAALLADLAEVRGYRFEGERLRLETGGGHVLMLGHPPANGGRRITAN